jgi:hypothetical protein
MGYRLVQLIRQMLELNWEINISHSYMDEANRYANGLTELSFT